MGWSAQYFTTIIIEGNTPLTGIFIYNGTPALGTLIGSWTAAAGTDAFGNSYPAGINVTQGTLQGVTISAATINAASNILSSIIANSTLNNNTINAGTINETTIIFDSGGGQLFAYTSTTTTVTETVAGDYTWTSPLDGTASISCIAGGAGGDGGTSSVGGNGGGAGEYAGEPNYPVVDTQVYSYTVGAGGAGNSTGGGHGTDGANTTFDLGGSAGGIQANGGQGNGTGGTGSTNSVHYNGGNGGASNTNTGAASGGNSGNKTAAGNNGIAPTSSSGAASPTAQTGSGTGGAGGNSGANGSNGGSPGAGGGGAGAGGSTPSSKSISYTPVWNGSYFGPDANSGAPPNGLRSTGTMYQGGETASGGSFNGNQRSVFAFNRAQIASDFAGYSITGCQVQFRNLHSWYSSGMTIELDEFQGLPGSVPSSCPTGDYRSADASLTIAEGATTVFSVATSIAARFVTGSSNGLGIGFNVAADHPYNLNYYGYFDPSQTRFKITGTIGGAGTTTAGDGADGSVVITYATASVLECAISPTSGTDSNGNNYAAGYTGQVSTFDPVTPANVETWHILGAPSGAGTYTGTMRYKLMPDRKTVRVDCFGGSFSSTGTALFPAMPSAYQPAQTINFGGYLGNNPTRCQVNSAGVVAVIVGASGVAINFCQDIPLD